MSIKKRYPVIEIPASGKAGFAGGAWCFYFMYTKHHGNFILKGYMREIEEYIKEKKYTHWFANYTIFSEGEVRWSNWAFWKENIGIFAPSKFRRNEKWDSKYIIREYFHYGERRNNMKIELKRMPHKWIPEFDKF